jgi:type I restriction enzyme S subunit
MSFPRYPAYKPSGVEWLGEVPETWEVKKLKNIASFAGGGTPSRENLDFWGGPIPWVSPKDMKAEKITQAEEGITQEGLDGSPSSLIAPGHVLLVVRSGILRHTIPVAINAVEVALNQDMKAIRLNGEICSCSFLLRWIQGFNDQLLLVWGKQGATVESIEQDYLSRSLVPLPPLSEQHAITIFLDRETAKIDALIAEQQRLIELLQEKRQAVISHAVTKGLNPAAPMKDSGVEWLGEVPEHWDVIQLKWLSPVKRGASPRPIDDPIYFDEDGEYAWVRISDVTESDGRLRSTTQRLSSLGSDLSVKLEPGSLFLSIAGSVGKPCISEIKACIHDGFVYFPHLPIIPEYLFLVFEAGACFGGLGKLGTQLNLNTDTIGSIYVALPPGEETQRILRHCSSRSIELHVLSQHASRLIELLQERRSALISAAVTGQIDVRGLVPEASAA